MKEFDYRYFRAMVLEHLKSGKPLLEENGAFTPLIEKILNVPLEGEFSISKNKEERISSICDDVCLNKLIHAKMDGMGDSTLNGAFQSKIAEKIVEYYGLGNRPSEIKSLILNEFGQVVSKEAIKKETDRFLPEIESWKQRPLETLYPIIWMDAIYCEVLDKSAKPDSCLIYNVLAIDSRGRRDLLGIYSSRFEDERLWLYILSDLQNRGVKEILIACTDNMSDFPELISKAYDKSLVQMCIVRQVRESIKNVELKDLEEFMKDLRLVYQAVSKKQAEEALKSFDLRWGKIYPAVVKSWTAHWNHLSPYLQYPDTIRRLIYTNTVDHYQKGIKNPVVGRGFFVNDLALEKMVYLAYRNVKDKWAIPLPDWDAIFEQMVFIHSKMTIQG
jgi:Transposase and inactivated derivatives